MLIPESASSLFLSCLRVRLCRIILFSSLLEDVGWADTRFLRTFATRLKTMEITLQPRSYALEPVRRKRTTDTRKRQSE